MEITDPDTLVKQLRKKIFLTINPQMFFSVKGANRSGQSGMDEGIETVISCSLGALVRMVPKPQYGFLKLSLEIVG